MNSNIEPIKSETDIFFEQLSKYATRIALLISGFTGAGGLLIILYMFQISYIPAIGISELTILFLASSLFGLLMCFVFAAAPMIVPNILLSMLSREGVSSYYSQKTDFGQSMFLLVWYFIPATLFSLAILFWSLQTIYSPSFEQSLLFVSATTILFLAVIALFAKIRMNIKFEAYAIFSAILVGSFVLILSSIGIVLAFLWEIISEQNPRDYYGYIVIVTMLLAVIPVSVVGINESTKINPFSKKTLSIVVPILMVFCILLIIPDSFEKFTSNIVRVLGVGGIENTKITFDTTGMNANRMYGNVCMKGDESCTIDNVKIVWGHGERYLLEFGVENSDANKASKRQFIIPESRILLIER